MTIGWHAFTHAVLVKPYTFFAGVSSGPFVYARILLKKVSIVAGGMFTNSAA